MNFKKVILILFVFGVLNSQLIATQFFMCHLIAQNVTAFSDNDWFIQSIVTCPDNSIWSIDLESSTKRGKAKNPEFEKRESGMGAIKLDLFFPEKILSGSTFLLKCRINKGSFRGAVKLTQQLPVHFDVVESDVANAKTEYYGNTLNLFWDNTSNDSIIEISYKVLVNYSYGYLPITSILYFGDAEEKHIFDTHILVDKVRPTEDYNTSDLLEKDTCLNFIALNRLFSGEDSNPNKGFDEKEQNVVYGNKGYSVQILAMKCNCDNLKLLKEKYNINKEISIYENQNWITYTIGKFKTVEEAYLYLTKIRRKGLSEAFIVGFTSNSDGIGFVNNK